MGDLLGHKKLPKRWTCPDPGMVNFGIPQKNKPRPLASGDGVFYERTKLRLVDEFLLNAAQDEGDAEEEHAELGVEVREEAAAQLIRT